MVLFISKRNEKVLGASPMSGKSFIHDCSDTNNSESVEDVRIISSTVEENGVNISTGKLKGDIMMQGAANTASTKSKIEGDDPERYTSRGRNSETTRERTFYEYIDNIN